VPEDDGTNQRDRANEHESAEGHPCPHEENGSPRTLRLDGSLARSLGFQPIVRTVYQAAQESLL
jgi:hypothetical protein